MLFSVRLLRQTDTNFDLHSFEEVWKGAHHDGHAHGVVSKREGLEAALALQQALTPHVALHAVPTS